VSDHAELDPLAAQPVARRIDATAAFVWLMIGVLVSQVALGGMLDRPAVQAWATVFLAVCVQASPFVVLGVAVSTAIAVFVPPGFFAHALPRSQVLAVPVAGLCGVMLPGCECGSVPIAASLSRRRVRAGPALAFLLSSPAINPVVLVATAVAFPGEPRVVMARFLASLIAAVSVGWVWSATGRTLSPRPHPHDHGGDGRIGRAVATASHDLAQTLGLLVVGAAAAATVNVALPTQWLTTLSGSGWPGVFALAGFAVVLAVCSEADAFIAASFIQFSITARLVFMVVGPAVDLKLIALQAGTFGRGFAIRFAPLTWLAATLSAVVVSWALL
jgi:uncharacterized protein